MKSARPAADSPQPGRIVAIAHPLLGREAELLAVLVALELAAFLVADQRQHRLAVDEAAVVDDGGVRSLVGEAVRRQLEVEGERVLAPGASGGSMR
jgi:hypothetical protein